MDVSETEAFEAFEQAGWERAAARYHHHWGVLSQQSAEPMLDAARVGRGSRVLDVATGAGYVAARAHQRGALATGLDFSPAQIELAKATYPGIDFRAGNAEALPFDVDSFDAVVVGFGVNHLPNPERGFAEAFRVLKRGGLFAFTVWAPPSAGGGYGIMLALMEQNKEVEARLPPGPPFFRFADPDEVRRMCMQAGFVKAETKLVPQFWRHTSPDQLFEAFNEGAVRTTAMMRAQPPHVLEKIRVNARREVGKLRDGDRYVVPMPAALSWAEKP